MGLTTAPILKSNLVIINGGTFGKSSNSKLSMSQGFHQGIYSFSEGTNQELQDHDQQQQNHIAQQSRRDKLRVQAGFDPPGGHHPLIPIHHQDEVAGSGIYEPATVSGNMLSEMFNFNAAMTPGAGPSASELLASQIQAGMYRLPPSRVPPIGFEPSRDNWYNSNNDNTRGGGQGGTMVLGGSTSSTSHLGGSIVDHPKSQLNAHDSAAVMQLFLMSPAVQTHDPRPSPPPPPPPQAALFGHPHQGLSLSLSSSLQPLDQDPLRARDGVLYFNSNTTNSASDIQGQSQQSQGQPEGGGMGYGVVNVLRNSKYSRAAQELLEEFCNVGRGQFKGSRSSRNQYGSSSSNPNPNPNATGSTSANAAAGCSSSSKDPVASLSPADRFEHQRKKSKLLSMLDEVDRRYNHYCDQMQMVVNSFDSVMGFGAATPYTTLAQKAMSRHFRCLKDAIVVQLKHTCELLGEKEVGTSAGITKGETPRLRLLDRSLRQQRAFHQMGMMEQEAWRPQRGLPERSVTVLRAWLFEHFLHPYPSDADKHLLARQTGLSRNQVSNWFINARVRLWKPMIEEMYQQEAKEKAEAGNSRDDDASNQQTSQSPTNQIQIQMQNQQRPETNAPLERYSTSTSGAVAAPGADDVNIAILPMMADTPELCGPHDALYREYEATGLGPAARMRLGTTGDVSLTLGLRHAGNNNAPEKNRPFTMRDFGC